MSSSDLELCVVAARLLQVIAEDLLLLDQPFSDISSSQPAKRRCRSARTSFGIAEYAASRIRRWPKR